MSTEIGRAWFGDTLGIVTNDPGRHWTNYKVIRA